MITLRNHVAHISSLRRHGRLTNIKKLVAKHKNPWWPELLHAKFKISLWNITRAFTSVTNYLTGWVSHLGVQFVHYEVTQRSLEEILFGVVLQQRIVHGAHSNLEHTRADKHTHFLTVNIYKLLYLLKGHCLHLASPCAGVLLVCYLFVDFDSFLVLLQLSAVVSDLQQTFVGWAETQTHTSISVLLLSPPLCSPPESNKRNIHRAELSNTSVM